MSISRALALLAVLFVVLGAAGPVAAASPVDDGPPVGSQFGADETANDTETVNATVSTAETASGALSDESDDRDTEAAVDDRNDSAVLVVLDTIDGDDTDEQEDGLADSDALTEQVETIALSTSTMTVDADGVAVHVSRVSFERDTVTVADGEPVPLSGQPDGGGPVEGPADGMAVGAGALLVAGAVRQAPGLATLPGVTTSAEHTVDRLARFLAVFRYSRYDDSDPLEHETRQTVYETIETEPGAYLSEVSEHAGIPLSTARHHVRVLEQENLVASAKVRGKRRFYPSDVDGIAVAAAIEDDATAAVLDALARLGPCSVAALADELDRDSSTVTHHLQRLDDDGLVERERDGRAVVNRLTPAARQLLEPERVGSERPEAMPADD